MSNNILKPHLNLTDRQFLLVTRIVVLLFSICVTAFAITSDASIYDMVGNAYKVTLVGAFVPLLCGIYWKRANTRGALLSIFLGVLTWVGLEMANHQIELIMPPQLGGLLAAIIGMVAGSLLTKDQLDY